MVGGYKLFVGFAAVPLISSAVCGLGAVHLLHSKGRDSVLPHRAFSHLVPSAAIPVLQRARGRAPAYPDTLTMSWEWSVEILNFDAPLAFMVVNMAAVKHFGFTTGMAHERKLFLDVIAPGLGFLFLPGTFRPATIGPVHRHGCG